MQQYVCDRCGRATSSLEDDFGDWLLGLIRSTGKQTIRCPQHITEWALRQAGYPRTRQIRRWVRESKKRDDARRNDRPPGSPFIDPFVWNDE